MQNWRWFLSYLHGMLLVYAASIVNRNSRSHGTWANSVYWYKYSTCTLHVFTYVYIYTVYHSIHPNHVASVPLPLGGRGGVYFSTRPPPNTPLDDVNHRLAWLNSHPLVINIIQKQYNTPTMGYNNVWRATNSSSKFHTRSNTRKFKSVSWFVVFTLEEHSQIPHFCGICESTVLNR